MSCLHSGGIVVSCHHRRPQGQQWQGWLRWLEMRRWQRPSRRARWRRLHGAAAAVAAGSPPTTRRPLAPLDKNSAAVKRSAPGQQGGSASELALLQLGTCEEPQLVDMIEALLVAHPELAPEVRQMLVER